MKKTAILLFLIIVFINANSQVFRWVKTLDANSNTNYPFSMSNYIDIDQSGFIHLAGSYMTAFDYTMNRSYVPLRAPSTVDLYFLKYHFTGANISSQTIYDGNFEIMHDYFINEHGIFFYGTISDTIDIDLSVNSFYLNPKLTTNYPFNYNGFIAKYTSNNQFDWAFTLDFVQPNDIAFDKSGNFYVVGYFDRSSWLDSGNVFLELPIIDVSNGVVIKYDSLGNYIWSKIISGYGYQSINKVDIDSNNNVYIGGEFNTQVIFDSLNLALNINSRGGNDLFLAKMDSNGQFLYVNHFGSSQRDQLRNLSVINQKVVFGGYSDSSQLIISRDTVVDTTINVGGFLSFHDASNGVTEHVESLENPIHYHFIERFDNRLLRYGIFTDSTTFTLTDSTTITLIPNGSSSTYFGEMNDKGMYKWVEKYGGTGATTPYDLVLKGDDFYMIGYFTDSLANELNNITNRQAMQTPIFANNGLFILSLDFSNTLTKNKEKILKIESYKVFPNPTNHYLKITGSEQISKYIIYNLKGQKIRAANYKSSIDVSNLEEGVYIVEFLSESKHLRKKFIKY